ncbi:MAG: hypothetical protein V2A62_04815 [Candidatus Woesearchaeota archaeon]
MTEHLFRLNTILWIEDQWEHVMYDCACVLIEHDKISREYGSGMKIKTLDIMTKLPPEEAQSEVERVIRECEDNPFVVNVHTAQLARTYLERITPGAIICDSSFPLNGKAVVGWLKEHGLPSYPLIGLSAKYFFDLPPEMQDFFTSTSAVYIEKTRLKIDDLVEKLVFSHRYVQIATQHQS